MKILIGLGHPAHFHLFKHFIQYCISNSYDYKVVILNKDVLEDLFIQEAIPYYKIIDKIPTKDFAQKFRELKRATRIFEKIVEEYNPTLMIGSINQIAQAGWKKRFLQFFLLRMTLGNFLTRNFNISLYYNNINTD